MTKSFLKRNKISSRDLLIIKLGFENSLKKKVKSLFIKNFIKTVELHGALGLIYFHSDFKNDFRDLLKKHYKTASDFILNKKYKKNFSIKSLNSTEKKVKAAAQEKINKIIDNIISQKVDSVLGTTESQIQSIVNLAQQRALSSGISLSQAELNKILRDTYLERINSRSSVIATTETNFIIEATRQQEVISLFEDLDEDELENELDEEELEIISQMEDSGLDADAIIGLGAAAIMAMSKRWEAVMDDKTRDAHAEADGQEVGLLEPFNVDGEELLYPGDPEGSPENIINCRCSVNYSF